jgi:hypothetical protein
MNNFHSNTEGVEKIRDKAQKIKGLRATHENRVIEIGKFLVETIVQFRKQKCQ